MKDFSIPGDRLTERRIGAIVTVRGETGDEYRARVVTIEGDTATVHPFEKLSLPSESDLLVTLIQALPKKEKMEWIIQKATELGVSALIPCISEKSFTLDERNRWQAKWHRWQEIARKATEQSRRRTIPVIAPCTTLRDAMDTQRGHASLNLILYEKEIDIRLRDLSWNGVKNLTIVCGPEGGFSEAEIAIAKELNYRPVSLGGRVLRCETAAIAALSIVQFLSGNL